MRVRVAKRRRISFSVMAEGWGWKGGGIERIGVVEVFFYLRPLALINFAMAIVALKG
jgi:hypothetical protein